jgi:hypothetical protein
MTPLFNTLLWLEWYLLLGVGRLKNPSENLSVWLTLVTVDSTTNFDSTRIVSALDYIFCSVVHSFMHSFMLFYVVHFTSLRGKFRKKSSARVLLNFALFSARQAFLCRPWRATSATPAASSQQRWMSSQETMLLILESIVTLNLAKMACNIRIFWCIVIP